MTVMFSPLWTSTRLRMGLPDSRAPLYSASALPALTPVINALLPDASEDPEIALEVADLTRERLRDLKHERLETVITELLEPTGAGGAVRISRGHEQEWLGALNDVRLVLAQRLDIDGPKPLRRPMPSLGRAPLRTRTMTPVGAAALPCHTTCSPGGRNHW